ncbi:hypothetical protein RTBOTA2_001698 [Rhodotorula toruloides]|nr:hypothetical protein RTBOTA2_001698 [Rhodotorula toruloides]
MVHFGACMQSQPVDAHTHAGPRRSDPFPFTFARPAGRAPRQSMHSGRNGGWASDESEESEGWTDEEFGARGEGMEGVEGLGGNERIAPSAATQAGKILRDFKRMPMANEPTDDLVAFKATYTGSLDKSKQVLGLMGEKNRDELAYMLKYETRKSKTLGILEEQKRKLVGDVAAADYKKAADLMDRLDSLASQAVQNRHQAKRDLEQIRTNTSARLASLKKQYEARAKVFESDMGELSAKTAQGLGAKGKGRGRKQGLGCWRR